MVGGSLVLLFSHLRILYLPTHIHHTSVHAVTNYRAIRLSAGAHLSSVWAGRHHIFDPGPLRTVAGRGGRPTRVFARSLCCCCCCCCGDDGWRNAGGWLTAAATESISCVRQSLMH